MPAKTIALVIGGAYLLGSVPFALLIGYAWKRVDIRNYGSGNIGASNVLRVLGWPAALLCLILDMAKGFVPVWVAAGFQDVDPLVVVGAGLAAIIGHNASVFLRFRGGKGVATSLGVVIGVSPQIAVLAFVIWLLVVTVTRFISVASICAGISVPIMMLLSSKAQSAHWGRAMPVEYIYLGLLGAGFILLKHRPNIVRLANGTEPRIGERVRVGVVTDSPGGGRADDEPKTT